jgi:hypothetical protein
LTVPNARELEYSTREHHAYLLDHYIEPRFVNVPILEMKVLMIDEWLLSLRGAKDRLLAGTTKASIRTLLSGCFELAAKHEFISAFEHNPIQLIEVKGVSKRQKEIQQITVEQFKSIRADLAEVLNVLVLVDASFACEFQNCRPFNGRVWTSRRKPSSKDQSLRPRFTRYTGFGAPHENEIDRHDGQRCHYCIHADPIPGACAVRTPAGCDNHSLHPTDAAGRA